MRSILSVSCAAILLAGATVASAEELKSGLQKGEGIGAFTVEKCGGAGDDGVAVGTNLCYRCKLGGRPMVMVFARTADDKLASLVAELDKTVAANKDKKLASFVNFLGSDADELKAKVAKFEKSAKAGSVALVIPDDQPNGPKGYKINESADVTVILAKDGKVIANHAVKSGGLDKDAVKKIVADAEKLAN
jgi:hypothetical protein